MRRSQVEARFARENIEDVRHQINQISHVKERQQHKIQQLKTVSMSKEQSNLKQNSEISLKKSELASANEQILRLSDALEHKATQLSSKDLEHEKQQVELQNLQSGTQALSQDCETHSRQN